MTLGPFGAESPALTQRAADHARCHTESANDPAQETSSMDTRTIAIIALIVAVIVVLILVL